jgi:Kef-type K+ transport system membrane component KefB
MHSIDFIQDLAVIMLIAGLVTILFHRLKQPVVLGYILAGVIIGPHTPPFALIRDEHTIRTLSELGVVFLLFALGLEFSLRKLARVGRAQERAIRPAYFRHPDRRRHPGDRFDRASFGAGDDRPDRYARGSCCRF